MTQELRLKWVGKTTHFEGVNYTIKWRGLWRLDIDQNACMKSSAKLTAGTSWEAKVEVEFMILGRVELDDEIKRFLEK